MRHTSRARHALPFVIAAFTVFSAPAHVAGQQSGAVKKGGTGTLYLGTYKGAIAIVDEASETVIGEIPLKTGAPRSLTLSHDRSRFYVLDHKYQTVEIIDRATRATVDTITLSEGTGRTRIWSVRPDPHDRYLILVTRTATLKPDRWEIGSSTIVQYDIGAKKILRTIPWPKGEERENADILFSPDGKLMYLFGEDVLIYETAKFTEVDRWELSRPVEPGTGRFNFGSVDRFNDEPGFFTGLFSTQDPIQRQRILGVGRVDLAKKSVDFYAIGPFVSLGFAMAPDRKRAYGLRRDVGEYEFWTFDLEQRRLLGRTEFKGRPRMALAVSTNGNLLYIYQAGNTIDLYDASTFAYLRTISLDSDMTTTLIVLPNAPSAVSGPGMP